MIKNYPRLQSNKTVNLNSGMSASEIRNIIDNQPRDLGGNTLLFQFADGVYTLDNYLQIKNFSNGTVALWGNNSDNTLSTSKSVELRVNNSYGFYCYFNSVSIDIRFLHINMQTSAQYGISVYSSNMIVAYYNYIQGYDSNGRGVQVYGGIGDMRHNFFRYFYKALTSNDALVHSYDNDSNGDSVYGLEAKNAGIIGKGGTNQPSGSTGDEYTTSGGVIR